MGRHLPVLLSIPLTQVYVISIEDGNEASMQLPTSEIGLDGLDSASCSPLSILSQVGIRSDQPAHVNCASKPN